MKEQKIKDEIDKFRSENVRTVSKAKALETHDGMNKEKSFPEKLVQELIKHNLYHDVCQ